MDVNAGGQIAFAGFTDSASGLFTAAATGVKTLALSGAVAPGGGTFASVSNRFSINDAGSVAFRADTNGRSVPAEFASAGIYLHTGTGNVALALTVAQAPSYRGAFSDFGEQVLLNSAGQVVFTGTTAHTTDKYVFLATTSKTVLLATAAPSELTLNDAGQVAFIAGSAIHLATIAGDAVIVSAGAAAPDGGTFSTFEKLLLNQAGEVAFRATTEGGPGSGVYLWRPTGLVSLGLKGGAAPGGGTFSAFNEIALIKSGQVAFSASTEAGGDVICLGDGVELIKVIGAGDTLLGVKITKASLPESAGVPEHGPVNDLAQVAYHVDFENGVEGLFIFTPSVHWRTAGSGTWDTAANWTVGIEPAFVHDVAIDRAAALTVTGPAASTTVRSLVVGSGAGAAELNLQTGVTLTTTNGLSADGNGTLSGTGTIGRNLALLTGAHVVLEVGGLKRETDYDFLKVTGRAVLAGTLDVLPINGLALRGGDTFDLFDLAARVGKFTTVNLPPLPAGLTWDTSKLYTNGTITVSMATFFAANQGRYSGLVTADPEAFASTGSLSLTLAQGGNFSGTLKIGGKTLPVRGTLDDAGHFTGALGNSGLSLSLQLDLANPTDQIAATIEQNGAVFSTATLDRSQMGFSTSNPVELAGTYTVALPTDPAHPEGTFPQGTGYGSLAVAPNGTVRLIGVLGDFTAFSPTGILSRDNKFSVFFPLYGGKGFISGVLTLQDKGAANQVEGALHWFKPKTNSAPYPAAFEGDLPVEGSRYTVPPTPPSPPQILPIGAATFTVSSGDVTAAPKTLNITAGNTVTVAPPEKFSLKVAVKTGIFTGAFLDSADRSRTFKGVFLQKQNVGRGVFKGEVQTGKFVLQPQSGASANGS